MKNKSLLSSIQGLILIASLAATIPTLPMANQLNPNENNENQTCKQALQIVLVNCLQRHDFEGVSHIIEKTQQRPGHDFVQMLKDDVSTPHFKTKNIDYCYELFKRAHTSKNARLLAVLRIEKVIMRVMLFASFIKRDRRTGSDIIDRPDYKEIEAEHNKQAELNKQAEQ